MARLLTIVVALAALLAVCPQAHVAQKQPGPDKAELAWTILPTRYLHYNVQSQRMLSPKGTPRTEDEVKALALQYNGFFGHEISPAGEFVKRIEPLMQEESLLQLAMYTPVVRQKVGATWQKDWAFSRIPEFGAFALTSSWELKPQAEYAGVPCWVIEGKHALKVPEGPPQAGNVLRAMEVVTTGWFDQELGALRGARVQFHGKMTTPPPAAPEGKQGPITYYAWVAEWRLFRDFESTNERIIDGRVERAIALGVEYLWQSRLPGGLWFYNNHMRGATALSLLALLMCDVPPADKRIIESFKTLSQQPVVNIYEVALSVMALEARYITVEERRSFLSSDKPQTFKRELSPEDRAEMQRLVDWIIDNQNDPNPFWNYSRGYNDNETRFDFSCTQYALLGLAAAQRCEMTIPQGVIRALVEETIAFQAATGPRLKRIIDYQPPKDPLKGKGRTTYSTRQVEARGWAYSSKATWTKETDITSAYGSMTASGVTCLMVGMECATTMSPEIFAKEFANRGTHAQWEKNAHDSLEAGMAWLEYWYSVTRNPVLRRTWYYYWMYGLERVGMLAGVKWIGEHNWYYEGCCPLLALQDGQGGWGMGPTDTAFALLFLKKGTVPPRRKVFTGEK